MAIVRQTWQQVLVKSQMGLFHGMRSFQVRFHWKFWQPIECVGGKVYFGRYAEVDRDEKP